jgi:cobalt-precorrin 5A hydrolase
MKTSNAEDIAIWVVTPNGLALAEKILSDLSAAQLFVSSKLETGQPCKQFGRLSAAVAENFTSYAGHVFITATGIAVRMIAPHLEDKTRDPAVVVLDEQGRHAVSLVSGHIGGANALAKTIAGLTGARPVITTATDVSGVPAIDTLAVEKSLVIENPPLIKRINMAFIRKQRVRMYDPANLIAGTIPASSLDSVSHPADLWDAASLPGVCVSDEIVAVPDNVLVLRPRSLAAGIGCNRNTTKEEIAALFKETLVQNNLSINSVKSIASIDIKNGEPGLLALGEALNIPLVFFKKEELNAARGIENPSATVATHTGAQSVCEAAAILATSQGSLIVPKRKSKNATVAIARAASI